MQKQPLGLMPKHAHSLKRIFDILEAISRYRVENMPVPIEWIDELKELCCDNKD